MAGGLAVTSGQKITGSLALIGADANTKAQAPLRGGDAPAERPDADGSGETWPRRQNLWATSGSGSLPSA